MRTKNVNEIDTCSQFHQHFKSSFCTDILLPKKIQIQTVTREKQLCITLLNEKGVCKMLMKLTPVVNFTNILQAAFSPIFFCQKITIVSREKQCKMLE